MITGIYTSSQLDKNDVLYNTVQGKPLFYRIDKSDILAENVGQAILINCTNVTIKNSKITGVGVAIHLILSNNCSIYNNTIENCRTGVFLFGSYGNEIKSNMIENCTSYGIYLRSSSQNRIFDNILNNSLNVGFFGSYSENLWNTTKTLGKNILGGSYLGGNVWLKSDGAGFSQVCEDNDSDGICDQVYQISSSNIDYLPLKYSLPPVASFTFIPTYPIVGEVVTFNGSSSRDLDGQIVSYFWNFGDGNTETTTSPTIQHTYSSLGTYTVTLTVTNNDGLTNTTSKQITVSAGESVPDGVEDNLEQLITKYYPSFDWSTDTPTQQDVVQAITNAVSQYFSTTDPAERQEILDDVIQLVGLYFQL